MSRRPRPRAGPVDRDELEGFLEGVTRRLATAPVVLHSHLQAALERARQELARGELELAQATLQQIDDRLAEAVEEPELAEFPRGLLRYDPIGPRGAPRPEEEDPVANRLRLLGRLLAVRASQGMDVTRWVTRLRDAEAALEAGDRARARALGEQVHDALEGHRGPAPEP